MKHIMHKIIVNLDDANYINTCLEKNESNYWSTLNSVEKEVINFDIIVDAFIKFYKNYIEKN